MAEIIAGEVQSMYILGDHRVPMMSSWFYKAAHPLALTVTFHIPTHPQVEWTFARELLLDTINGGTSTFRGEGDVGFKRVDFHDRSVVSLHSLALRSRCYRHGFRSLVQVRQTHNGCGAGRGRAS